MPRWLKVLIGVIVAVALLVGAFFIVDGIIRSIAQDRIAAEIRDGLPDTVEADFTVEIGGASVIAQYLSGRFEHVSLRDDALSFEGTTAGVFLEASGIPTDFDKPVEVITGSVVLDQAAVDRLWNESGQSASLVLGDGTVAYDGELSLLGLSIGYRATATPEAAGDSVLLRAEDAEITTAAGALNLTTIVNAVLGGEPIALCVAEYLPDGVLLDNISVTPDAATIRVQANQFVVSGDALETTGSCVP